ncbi:MAG: 23S rRNA (guanine1835-N2)-methyltransferase [Halieaceae bacterium]|jgi:23S rRNA (guanine1835-N2)-methyltransferase
MNHVHSPDQIGLLEGLSLVRHPASSDRQLRAFNGADKLLLEQLQSTSVHNILLVNDEHGALAVASHHFNRVSWQDSRLSELATLANLRRNKLPHNVQFVAMDQAPGGSIDLVLLRIPKMLDLLTYQLEILRSSLELGTPVYAAGMDKHLSSRTAAQLTQFLGPTERHKGQYKAHLYASQPATEAAREPAAIAFKRWHCAEAGGELVSAAGCFSRDQLDIGARCLLELFPQLPPAEHIVDLGCGNGVLGIAASQRLRPKTLTLFDESAMAIVSARNNAERLINAEATQVRAVQADGIELLSGPAPDLLLLNPPFHQNFTVDESVGRRLVSQAAEAIAPSGALWLVANRHLNYATQCQQLFSSSRVVGSNRKFVVIEARK